MIQNSPPEIVQHPDIKWIDWYQGEVLKGTTQADKIVLVDNENQISVNYDFQNTPPGYDPVRQKYSYWPVPNPIWRIQVFKTVYGLFPPGVVPDPNIPSELIVRIYGEDWHLHFLGADTSQPPLVQAYTTKIVGSDKKPKTVIQQHVQAQGTLGTLIHTVHCT